MVDHTDKRSAWSASERTPPAYSVLIAEDHEHTARFLESGFAQTETDVTTTVVDDGRACLAELGQSRGLMSGPDLLLLDLDLPGRNGLSILRRRANDPPLQRIPVIVVSGQDDQRTVDRSYAAGATAFISKPADLGAFYAIADLVAEFLTSTPDRPTVTERGDVTDHVDMKVPSGAAELSPLRRRHHLA